MCLSAQSNPQGVPKELLEAKKLELIQEKVIQAEILEFGVSAHLSDRSTLRKPPKRTHAEKSRRGRGKEISILSDSVSAVNVGEGVAGVTGEAVISIEAHLGTLDLHLHDVEVLPEVIIVALHPGAKSIHTYQAIVAAVDSKAGVADHPPLED